MITLYDIIREADKFLNKLNSNYVKVKLKNSQKLV